VEHSPLLVAISFLLPAFASPTLSAGQLLPAYLPTGLRRPKPLATGRRQVALCFLLLASCFLLIASCLLLIASSSLIIQSYLLLRSLAGQFIQIYLRIQGIFPGRAETLGFPYVFFFIERRSSPGVNKAG
jgi:hypothetical protein